MNQYNIRYYSLASKLPLGTQQNVKNIVAYVIFYRSFSQDIGANNKLEHVPMSNWQRWPDAPLNARFAEIEHPSRIVFPNLRDNSPLVLACDHSGEHALPEFRVLSFLVTTYQSVASWEPVRLEIRKKHLIDGRRMSFKDLKDALRINAFPHFLDAASQLNGVLICIGVEKGMALHENNLAAMEHSWTIDTLNKLVEICIFGGTMIDGLRGEGQPVHWITDDDSTVSTEKAQRDAANLMSQLLHSYPNEHLEIRLGIASKFDDDRRAEDLIAIPDLAAGAFSEILTMIGSENMPTPNSPPKDKRVFAQVKSTLINAWRSEMDQPLKHMNVVIRPSDDEKILVSFAAPFTNLVPSEDLADGAPSLNSKWRRALEAHLRERDIDSSE